VSVHCIYACVSVNLFVILCLVLIIIISLLVHTWDIELCPSWDIMGHPRTPWDVKGHLGPGILSCVLAGTLWDIPGHPGM
jgi:hypothetical protein